MINKKIIIIMVGLFILIIIVGVIGFFVVDKKNTDLVINNKAVETNNVNNGQMLPTISNNENKINYKNKVNITPKEKEELTAVKLANFFVSMLGSYSTDANFKNIIDLKPMMTDRMKSWADDFIKRNLDNDNVVYITTKSFNSEIKKSSDNIMIILVKTRREIKSNDEYKIYNQDAIVTLNKLNSRWLVDSVVWQ